MLKRTQDIQTVQIYTPTKHQQEKRQWWLYRIHPLLETHDAKRCWGFSPKRILHGCFPPISNAIFPVSMFLRSTISTGSSRFTVNIHIRHRLYVCTHRPIHTFKCICHREPGIRVAIIPSLLFAFYYCVFPFFLSSCRHCVLFLFMQVFSVCVCVLCYHLHILQCFIKRWNGEKHFFGMSGFFPAVFMRFG